MLEFILFGDCSIIAMEDQRFTKFAPSIQRQDALKLTLHLKPKSLHAKQRKVKTWSPEEDQQLISLYQLHPKKWATIAALMTDRNENQCLHRYRRITQFGAHRKIWSPDQDDQIQALIKKVGKNWKLLSQMLGTKTGKQIRQRFINKLDPRISKEEWSEEQDRKIIELYCLIGRKWSQISKQLEGRPENKIKNRFYSYIQKNYDIKCLGIKQEREDREQDQLEDLDEQDNMENMESCEQEQKNQQQEQCYKAEASRLKCEQRHSFKEISNQMRKKSNQPQSQKEQKGVQFALPSINHLDCELRMDEFPQENQKKSTNAIPSMMKIEQQWLGKDTFGPNSDLHSDFFYL